ncbi:hypothetical protein [Bacillus rhizoplanae]|uniref:hypothetical protein n=1 Tax=Bacillus rhizoplanae TaxID=2880966 RepID=UPI003D204185
MEQKIICFSACSSEAYKNFQESVEQPLSVNQLGKNIKVAIQEVDSSLDSVSIWAMRYSPKNQKLWEKIDEGDIALFYGNRKFISYGKIIKTLMCEQAAKNIFGDTIYKLLIIMEKNKAVDQKRDKLWNTFKYSEIARIQGMMIPNIKVQNELLQLHNNNISSLLNDLLEIKDNVG